MSTSEKLNIFINDNNRNEILDNRTETDRYIILQNDHLHAIVSKNSNKIHELKTKIEELEEDDDKNTRTNSNLKGLLKNLNEINKLKDEIIDCHKLYENYTNSNTVLFRNKAIRHVRLFESILLVFCALCCSFTTLTINILIFIIAVYSVSFIESFKFNVPDSRINPYQEDYDKLNIKLQDINKANDYIYELVDYI